MPSPRTGASSRVTGSGVASLAQSQLGDRPGYPYRGRDREPSPREIVARLRELIRRNADQGVQAT